jgi:hypothetical protein
MEKKCSSGCKGGGCSSGMAQEFGQGEAQGQRSSTHALPHAVRAHTPAHAGEGEEQRYNTQRDFHLRRSNRMLLWHGSRISNWAAILSTGPLLPSCPTLICPHTQRTRTHARTHARTHTHTLTQRPLHVCPWGGLVDRSPHRTARGACDGLHVRKGAHARACGCVAHGGFLCSARDPYLIASSTPYCD